jgi:hypothetical protein
VVNLAYVCLEQNDAFIRRVSPVRYPGNSVFDWCFLEVHGKDKFHGRPDISCPTMFFLCCVYFGRYMVKTLSVVCILNGTRQRQLLHKDVMFARVERGGVPVGSRARWK